MKTRPSAKTGEATSSCARGLRVAEASGRLSDCRRIARLRDPTPRRRTQPTIASAEEHLYAPVDIGRHRAGPLAVQHLLTGADGAPDHVARTLVHRDQTGARGDGTRVWPSFRPLEVETISRSPTGNTSLLVASWGKTPRRPHMSSSQTMSAAVWSWKISCRYGPLFSPSRKPRVSRQRSWHSAVTWSRRLPPHTARWSSKATETLAGLARLAARHPATGICHPSPAGQRARRRVPCRRGSCA